MQSVISIAILATSALATSYTGAIMEGGEPPLGADTLDMRQLAEYPIEAVRSNNTLDCASKVNQAEAKAFFFVEGPTNAYCYALSRSDTGVAHMPVNLAAQTVAVDCVRAGKCDHVHDWVERDRMTYRQATGEAATDSKGRPIILWGLTLEECREEVIVHNTQAPYNKVWRAFKYNAGLVNVIDYAFCEPYIRVWGEESTYRVVGWLAPDNLAAPQNVTCADFEDTHPEYAHSCQNITYTA